jgi:hypothetical protein
MAQCTTDTIQYYKGESIPFYVTGDEIDNLETNVFKVLFYSVQSSDIVIAKADMTKIADNDYYAEISNVDSAKLATGDYTMEILLGDDSTSIWKGFAFKMLDSHSKKYVQ